MGQPGDFKNDRIWLKILHTFSLGEYLGVFFSFFKNFEVNLISKVGLMFCYQMLQSGLRIIEASEVEPSVVRMFDY